MIIVGDIHGCYRTLMALIGKFPSSQKLCFVGDLIDRGPDDLAVVNYVMQNNHACVMGNHEDLCVDSYRYTRKYDPSDWVNNGGMKFTYSEDQIEWMSNLPKILVFDDCIKDGRKLLVSHTMFREMEGYLRFYMGLWDRFRPIDHKGYYNVFGHTPTIYGSEIGETDTFDPIIKDFCANIDTGCVYESRYPKEFPETYLTALQFPEMIVYRQRFIG